jgi:hypothetical protein
MGKLPCDAQPVTRRRKSSAYTEDDIALIETLFDIGEQDHVVYLIEHAYDPQPPNHRGYLADALEKYLLPHSVRFIEKLFEQGRGQQAVEFEAATTLRDTTENLIKLFRLSNEGDMSKADAALYAEELDDAWTRLIARGSAYRMGQLTAQLNEQTQRSTKANTARQVQADNKLLADFTKWQIGAAPKLVGLTDADRVQKFKIANRRLSDRATRRINQLLKLGKIPPLQK